MCNRSRLPGPDLVVCAPARYARLRADDQVTQERKETRKWHS
jgi:hypothetical protein